MGLVKKAIPQDMALKVTEINPRFKDGGAFVKFEHAASLDAAEIESKIERGPDPRAVCIGWLTQA